MEIKCSYCGRKYSLETQTNQESSDDEIIIVRTPHKKKKIYIDNNNHYTTELPNIYRLESQLNNCLYYPYNRLIYDPEIDLLERSKTEYIHEKEKWKRLYQQKNDVEALKLQLINSKYKAFENMSKSRDYKKNTFGRTPEPLYRKRVNDEFINFLRSQYN